MLPFALKLRVTIRETDVSKRSGIIATDVIVIILLIARFVFYLPHPLEADP